MHLWPSLRLRDAFKFDYLTKIEWKMKRMKEEKADESQRQRLLEDKQGDGTDAKDVVDEGEAMGSDDHGIHGFCKDFFLILSCCYCCFCCGACEEENDR
ncbi:uncharacterized protein LOC105420828 [Amborella trichopoda]|uniref:uncharacterized protein LOC105420828 n=1 Tax=Amborella trichopoda TaxID=13333 RepID=UPI0005D3FA63|nr:uncharacterized protein LOC105420828 [Amborella trichopoda]|eukprot:XP_011624259.1 uncharacterized protein LOC105420828 [Amborella trichopoda]